MEIEKEKSHVKSKEVVYSQDYLNYVKRELENLQWEHAWMESYYKEGRLESSGITEVKEYDGIARYCRCYLCRPDVYNHLHNLKDPEIQRILLGIK